MSLETRNAVAYWASWIGFAFVVIIALYCLYAFGWLIYNAIRRARARRRIEAEFARRPRGRVAKIGTITRLPDGRDRLDGFEIDCLGKLPVCETVHDGKQWVTLLGGFTIPELKEMARRRSEFE